MSVKEHPDYKEEKDRLEYTKDYIEMTLNATEEYERLYKENIKDAMINLDYLDSSQSYISVLVNTKFMEMAERNYHSLTKALTKPYFARMDIKSKDSSKTDKMYIGKTSLFRAEDNIPLIIDWRSPIANVYYEGRLGEVSYPTETGIEEGELLLKRQFTISDGELENILDIDITTTDTFLQASLEAHADNRLKDIASTIQAEQNRVIRADMDRPLIVQGVAGSGKTTIALHRIAYFIYTYEETFDPENFMILAPNNLFINYISEVLPELGVERVRQTTFTDFVMDLLGTKFKLKRTDEKLMSLIENNHKQDKDLPLIEWAAAFKGSLVFKEVIDQYIHTLEKQFVPELDFVLQGRVIVTAESIRKMFIEELQHLPLYKRVNEIKKTLTNQLKYIKSEILKDTENKYDKQIDYLRENEAETAERRLKIVGLIEERDARLASLKNEMKTLVKKYILGFPNKNLIDYYRELVTNQTQIFDNIDITLPSENIKYLTQYSRELLDKKKIELEDCAALLYMKHRIFGFDKKVEINSVVIDEAQDFSLFQFYALKEVLNTDMFTILGDLSQGIHAYRGIQNWDEVLDCVFDKKKSTYLTLEQSYRTTIEVMNLANEVIQKLNREGIVLAKPVIRHGIKPILKRFNQDREIYTALVNEISKMKDQNYKSIALIGKTLGECMLIKKEIDMIGSFSSKILDEKETAYDAGVVIIPSHLAKGLEFDVVFIVNINETYENKELDIKLLYVAMTRTLHQLYIFEKVNKILLLKGIDREFFHGEL